MTADIRHDVRSDPLAAPVHADASLPQAEVGPRYRVAIISDQTLVRALFSSALGQQQDFDDPLQFESVDGLRQQGIGALDVVLVDGALIELDFSALIRELPDGVECENVLAFGAHEQPGWLLDAVQAGLGGFIPGQAPLSELVSAVRAVARGQLAWPRAILRELLLQLTHLQQYHEATLTCLEQLTRQEQRVAALLAQGATNDVIADDLVISPQTARTHVQNILGKLGLHSRLEVMTYVLRNPVLASKLGVKQ